MAPSCTLIIALCFAWANSARGDVNVYGKPMTACGPSHGAGCTYAAYDAGAHQVCVTQLPEGFSSVTGQGPWSDEFTGQPWCICIWAYSNYILKNKDLPLKCESIPAKVLEEQYSLDKFKQCGSMSSTEGCGPEDIRRSIQSLCQQCDGEAEDATAKSALKSKCDAILASAPAAPMTRLYEQPPSAKDIAKPSSMGDLPASALGIFGVIIAVVSVAMLVRKVRRSPEQDQ